MGVKAGYLSTEIGVIPKDWETQPISTIVEIFGGGTPNTAIAEYWDGQIPWVSAGDVSRANGRHIQNTAKFISKQGLASCSAKIMPPGAVVIIARGATVGRMAQLGSSMTFNQTCYGLLPVEGTDQDYLYYAMLFSVNAMEALTYGTVFTTITTNSFEQWQIPLPPLPEQRAIAEALSDVDALISALDRLIAKKRAIKQGAMQQLLTGQTRLPGFKNGVGSRQTEAGIVPNEWGVKKLLDLVNSHNSGVYKRRELYGQGDNIIGVSDLYGIDSVNGQVFDRVPLSQMDRTKHILQQGDMLYGESSLVREGIARTVYVTENGAGTAFAWHTRRYSINQQEILSVFLYYYLQSRSARKFMLDNSIQTAITGINTAAYFSCPVLIPPIPEQRAIAEVLSDMDTEITALEARRDKTRALKQGMMQELLTGRIRLV